jgi:hypothetical protein
LKKEDDAKVSTEVFKVENDEMRARLSTLMLENTNLQRTLETKASA